MENNIFVISLDNEIGRERRSKLNYKYTWWKGVEGKDVPPFYREQMKFHPNAGEYNRNGKLGCFYTYLQLLQYIFENKLDNVIVLEDDCILIKEFNIEDLPNEPCYLNGSFFNPFITKQRRSWVNDFIKNNKFNTGVNQIDFSNFKILGTLGIWFPNWYEVEEIYAEIMITSRYKAIDNMLAELQLIKLFYYPSLYIHQDIGISNINKKNYTGKTIINYIECKL